MSLTTDITLVLSTLLTKNAAKSPSDFSAAVKLSSDEADQVYVAEDVVLAAASSDNYDLAGGLNDAFGDGLFFTSVKALAIISSVDNTSALEITGTLGPIDPGGSGDIVNILPGGALVLLAPAVGYPVVPSTGDILEIVNTDPTDSCTYSICIIGKS
jgi:hypothetical protein